MATDWAARLDARGYHATSISRGDTAVRWEGDTWLGKDGWTEGDSIIAFDPNNPSVSMPVKIGDVIYLSGVRKGYPAEIGRVESFFADEEGHIWMMNSWFWRPERLGELPEEVDWHARELFGSPMDCAWDENSTCSIELIKPDVTKEEKPPAASVLAEPHRYFWRRTYDVATEELSLLPSAPKPAAAQQPPSGAQAPPPKSKSAPRPKTDERVKAAEARLVQLEELVAQLTQQKDAHEQQARPFPTRAPPPTHHTLTIRRPPSPFSHLTTAREPAHARGRARGQA